MLKFYFLHKYNKSMVGIIENSNAAPNNRKILDQ